MLNNIRELKKLEESLWREKTRFDQKYMDEIMMPDFFEFGRSGRTYTRKQILKTPPGEINAKLPLRNFEVHPIDTNVFLVTYISEDAYDGIAENANRSSLWLKTPKGWKLRFHQGTATPHPLYSR